MHIPTLFNLVNLLMELYPNTLYYNIIKQFYNYYTNTTTEISDY